MDTTRMTGVVEHLCRAVVRNDAGLSDRELLAGFVGRRDQAALATLVGRHAPMVWGVCRRIVRDHQDAEDAFQATFLILVRKAATIASPELLANWLHGVARQTALKARAAAARRREREGQVPPVPEPAVADPDPWHDLRPLLDDELARLPAKYRSVILLCDVEGMSRLEVARHLGVPMGTVGGRLARARALLARRLIRRGVALSAGALAPVLSRNAVPGAPPAVMACTTQTGTLQAAATGAIPTRVAALTEGVLKAMSLNKLKVVAVVLLAVASVVGSGTLALSRPAAAGDPTLEATKAEPPVKADEAVSVAAQDILRTFNSNEARADEQWAGKRLQVTGVMQRVRRHSDKYVLTMGGFGVPLWFEFDAKDRKKLAALGAGYEVTVRGRYEGGTTVTVDGKGMSAIRFSNCEIVDAKPDRGREQSK